MAEPSSIPQDLAAVSPGMLTALLADRFPGVRVAAFEIEDRAHGTATKALLRLAYAPGPQGPPRMWIKGGWEPTSEILRGVGIFSREPRVYAELLADLPVNAPRCYGAAWDEARLDGVLLLEDLRSAGAVFRNPLEPVRPDEAERMLAMLAQMHGRTFRQAWQAAHGWLRPLFSDVGEPGSYLAYICETPQLESYLALPRGDSLPSELQEPNRIQRAFERTLAAGLLDTDVVMLHGDAHIGNSYRGADGRPGLLDWQCVWRGAWGFDVAYYLASALSVEDRRAHERRLLAGYLGELAAAGGPDLDPDEGLRRYLDFLPYGFLVWLANSTTFQPEAYNAACAGRFAQAMVDHGLA
ncbi:MAG: phosphotransferase [Caulobacterales bacterium]|nr:phosphotransferase [Caulobacterales bacterium]